MKHLQRSAFLLFITLCVPIAGYSASFDCANAASYVEKVVCSDAELSKLDDALGAAYRAASANADAGTQLTRDQRRWLGIRNACRDRACIKSAYGARIVDLRAMESAQRAAVARRNAETDKTGGVCAYVARTANLGKLEDVVLKGRPWNDSSFPTPADLGSVGVTFRDSVDINNDGRPEYVYVTSEGTAHFEGLVAYDADLRKIEYAASPGDDWQSNNLRWASDRRIIRYKGLHYIIGKSDDYLNYVTKIGPDNVEKVLCEFGQKRNPSARVAVAKDKPVCDAALQGNLDYVVFDKLHAVTVQDLQRAGIAQTALGEKAAKVDIDNDGRQDYVVATELASGAGRGCDSYGLALLNEARTALADSPVAKLLIETGGECGGARVSPFRFKGKTYLEHKYAEGHPANVHSVFKIENGKRDVICRLEARVVNYVLSRYDALVHSAEASFKNPWEYAFERSGLKDAELLIKNGRDVNETISSMSLLNWAVWRHRDDLLELLLKSGADPNRKNQHLSPLFEAIWRGTDESVAILMRYGAQLNIGNTDPIMEAVDYGYVAKLKIIIKAGIRPEQRHLDWARRTSKPNPEIIQVLESAVSR